jgi:hypothetical protein
MRLFGALFNRSSVDEKDRAGGGVYYRKWRLDGDTLSCGYKFEGLSRTIIPVSLRIKCRVSKFANGRLQPCVRLFFQPTLFLQPFFREPLDPEGGMMPAPFHVGLVSSEAGLGTEKSPVVQGGVFTVQITLEEDAVCLSVNEERLCLKAIWPGKEMTFTIVDPQTEPSVKLQLRLPNDPGFPPLFEKLCQATRL